MLSSIRHAIRSLIASPAFTLIALCTLALGVGVNSAMYSLVNELLFTSTAYKEPKRVVQVFGSTPQSELLPFSAPEWRDFQTHVESFETVSVFRNDMEIVTIDGQPPEQVGGTLADQNLLPLTGLQPVIGRNFTAEECGTAGSNLLLISESFWKRAFGGKSDVLGKSIQLTGKPFTIIGVVPDNLFTQFIFGEAEYVKPIFFTADQLKTLDYRVFGILGRLKAGASRESAVAQLQPLAERWLKDTPRYYEKYKFRVEIAGRLVDKGNSVILFLQMFLAFAILVIACTNLANLQLARATARMKELAIRSALGANRSALIRYQMVESLLLSIVGAAIGLLLAVWINDMLGSNIRIGLKSTLTIHLDGTVILFTACCAIFTAAAFGLIPAWLASRTDINQALKSQARGSTGGKISRKIRAALVVAQVAMAFTLLTVAASMVATTTLQINEKPNWDADKLLTANTQLDENLNPDEASKNANYKALQTRLEQIPGVEAVSLSSGFPFVTSGGQTRTVLNDTMDVTSKDLPTTRTYLVGPTHFKTLGIEILEGRTFPDNTQVKDPEYAIVSASLAKALWPDQSALGRRLGQRDEKGEIKWREVIGVTKDADIAANLFGSSAEKGQVYYNMIHTPWSFINIGLRSDRPAALAGELRRAVAEVNPLLPVRLIWTFDDIRAITQHNIFIVNGLMCGFALLGIILASVGLYGVVSNNVQQRLNEFGIRLALGAQPRDILRLVMRSGYMLTGIGLLIGAGFAYVLLAQIDSQFPPPKDYSNIPITLATLLIIASVATLSTWLPARKATEADPMLALRAD